MKISLSTLDQALTLMHKQVVAAAVAHAMEATRGQREMHARYEGNPESSESMHDPGATGRSHMHEARAAAEARGDYIFAKPDHLGIQVMILCARLQGCALACVVCLLSKTVMRGQYASKCLLSRMRVARPLL